MNYSGFANPAMGACARPAAAILVIIIGLTALTRSDPPRTPRIGATSAVTEASTGLTLEARVDTGAASCSIHCEEIEIPNESANPTKNVGRPVRCLLKNKQGQTAWLETEIIGHSGVRTSTDLDDRYFVNLRIRANGLEQTVRASLNDRTEMTYPFLMGRNFLRDNFVVDVTRDRYRRETGN